MHRSQGYGLNSYLLLLQSGWLNALSWLLEYCMVMAHLGCRWCSLRQQRAEVLQQHKATHRLKVHSYSVGWEFFIICICSRAVRALLQRPMPLALAGEGILKFPSEGMLYSRAGSLEACMYFCTGMNGTWLHWLTLVYILFIKELTEARKHCLNSK